MKKLTTKIAIIAATLATAISAHAGSITVKGSDTLVILAQKWAEVYMGKHPETKIQVSGGGSGVGFAALQSKQTDIADASRKIKSTEIQACIRAFYKAPREYKVAVDGLSVYVNNDNPVKELSLEQLEGIFTGRIKNWKEVGGNDGPISVYSRENNSGTYEFFKEHVLKGKDFVASAQMAQGTAMLLQGVSKDKGAIGYGGAAYGAGARALGIKKDENSKAIEPNEETVLNQTYPIWRYLYNYVNPALDKGEVASYLSWIRSDEGQKIVKEVGYYPLPANLREK
ncbi:phosphate ABC transporter substrate-binding protein [Pedosphaera parvula]|uniref:Phosphate-binding protein n=1 Tax=Pedosphaera parvula (strain Ellin514) TaxID=320771 RepID=B9XLG3_PEDPL|nr:phosphate ABC transporter substrate-binding protein [Pedosphaera parvula]EEF59366.1 phosphate binding protein [Pedosphaera parvula Ellin514]